MSSIRVKIVGDLQGTWFASAWMAEGSTPEKTVAACNRRAQGDLNLRADNVRYELATEAEYWAYRDQLMKGLTS